MNSEQITAFLQEHWNWVTLIIGVVLLIGAIMNWNWLCAPTGKPDSHRYGRGSRRSIINSGLCWPQYRTNSSALLHPSGKK